MTLRRGTLLNLAGAGLPMIVGVVAIPFLISKLGMERFGILTILWAIIGYFGLFDFGVGRATTQQVAARLGNGLHDEIEAVIRSGVKLSLLTGTAGVLILGSLSYALSYKVLNVSPGLEGECLRALLITAVGIPLATMSSAYRGAIEAYERFRHSNIARIILGTSIFVFPALGLSVHGASLEAVAVWLVIARMLGLVTYWHYARQLPHYSTAGLMRLDPVVRKKLFSLGAWMTASNLVSPILVNADRLLVSNLMGATVVAYYTVPFEVLARLLIVPGAIGATLLPRLSSGFPDNGQATRGIFAKSVRVTASIMAGICLIAAIVSYPMMHYLISDDFARKSWPVALVLTLGVFINSVAYLPYTALHANGAAKPVAVLHIAELVVYIPVVILLVSRLGLIGAAISWTLRASLDCVGLFVLYRKLDPSVRREDQAVCSIQD